MRWPSRIASGRIEKSSRTSTRSATPRVAGLPLCIAMPTSAVRTGRMSLTPSPVIATYRPRALSTVTSRALRCGSTRPKIVVRVAASPSASSSRCDRSRPEGSRDRRIVPADGGGGFAAREREDALPGRGKLDRASHHGIALAINRPRQDGRRAQDVRPADGGVVIVDTLEADCGPAQGGREGDLLGDDERRAGKGRPERDRRVVRSGGARGDGGKQSADRVGVGTSNERLDGPELDSLGRQGAGLVATEGVDPAHRLDRALPLGERPES